MLGAELDYKPDIDIIYTSSEASGGSWRLSDDQTKCLNSPEIDASQPNRHTDKLKDSSHNQAVVLRENLYTSNRSILACYWLEFSNQR